MTCEPKEWCKAENNVDASGLPKSETILLKCFSPETGEQSVSTMHLCTTECILGWALGKPLVKGCLKFITAEIMSTYV